MLSEPTLVPWVIRCMRNFTTSRKHESTDLLFNETVLASAGQDVWGTFFSDD